MELGGWEEERLQRGRLGRWLLGRTSIWTESKAPLLINLPEVLEAVDAGVQVEGQGEAGGVGPRALHSGDRKVAMWENIIN